MQESLKLIGVYLALSIAVLLSACGPDQIAGPPGANGDTGATGQTGSPGISPTVTVNPASTNACPTGGYIIAINGSELTICNGAVGTPGVDGKSIVGPPGAQGPAGTPGTQIRMVQFCPGVTPTYPSTFPESGIVIGSTVWGVYSANGGFLALLPPGQYSSNGINASCTFTINADGSISQ